MTGITFKRDSYKGIFVAVNFYRDEDTLRLIQSIARLENSSDVCVVIVDNRLDGTKRNSLVGLEKSDLEIVFVGQETNPGYFGGAKSVVEKIHQQGIRYHWLVVSNTDLEVVTNSFVRDACEVVANTRVGVVAPAIYSTWSGRNQNPYLVKLPPLWTLRCKSLFFRTHLTTLLYHVLSLCKTMALRALSLVVPSPRHQSPRAIYAPHGSFILFTPSYFKAGGSLNHFCFLFGEEFFVAETAKASCLEVVYVPTLEVYHREHATTGVLPGRKMTRHMRESSECLVRLISKNYAK